MGQASQAGSVLAGRVAFLAQREAEGREVQRWGPYGAEPIKEV